VFICGSLTFLPVTADTSMITTLTPDICVIGAGSAGLSVAAGAAQLGAETVLIEAHKMGGDCLNYGCVPSKALLAAAQAAEAQRHAGRFGVQANEPLIDFRGVHDHVMASSPPSRRMTRKSASPASVRASSAPRHALPARGKSPPVISASGPAAS